MSPRTALISPPPRAQDGTLHRSLSVEAQP